MADLDDNAGNDGEEGREDGRDDRSTRAGQDYEIGYGKPPRAHQFPKGKSGNPRGPKKGSRGLKKDLHKALSLPHTIRAEGKTVTGTTQEMAMYTLAKRAGTGDLRAIRELIDLTLKVFGAEDRGRERTTLSAQDQELLDRMLAREDAEEAGSAGERDAAGRDSDTSGMDAEGSEGAEANRESCADVANRTSEGKTSDEG